MKIIQLVWPEKGPPRRSWLLYLTVYVPLAVTDYLLFHHRHWVFYPVLVFVIVTAAVVGDHLQRRYWQ